MEKVSMKLGLVALALGIVLAASLQEDPVDSAASWRNSGYINNDNLHNPLKGNPPKGLNISCRCRSTGDCKDKN
ncbi:hypothetical protein E2562_009240 [Oryza meyeriana var. granulata]|uniref:Uncharacterized protein n=1 Tax=Oryza meyeriana var. granulata TaxID=110450 RepID=A0A6G1D036_9ORYZ|nr:hypothetical protein E2562_009240 [Oryza meyeriana var. granulata]